MTLWRLEILRRIVKEAGAGRITVLGLAGSRINAEQA
jgi:hypothetical protein